MFLAIIAVIIGAVLAAAVVRLSECHVSVNDLLTDLDHLSSTEGPFAHSMAIASSEAIASAEPADVLFTESLLALSKVGLRAPDDSRAPELAESSLLVSVRPAR